ncbi:Ethylene-responsive transcription factor SHINE 2 [Bienertia sinuspersici]
MNGQNAKTNFPRDKNNHNSATNNNGIKTNNSTTNDHDSTPFNTTLSEILSAKLKKYCKDPSPSLTCLRLDTDNSHIGVWQKRAGSCSSSSWVMRVELGKSAVSSSNKECENENYDISSSHNIQVNNDNDELSPLSTSSNSSSSMASEVGSEMMSEEDRAALQMIEELLNWNNNPPSSTTTTTNYD